MQELSPQLLANFIFIIIVDYLQKSLHPKFLLSNSSFFLPKKRKNFFLVLTKYD